ncbi:MAG TPA: DNA adenine methylase [Methylotenera sp.]|nr:DNA adenine methylase [Methylotenera sp.]HPN01044.1 DNA adenine methylase [Methylotenera sp.]
MLTPLRYPGGKARLGLWIASLLKHNNISNGTYVEAYAGGAGAAMYLLINKHVSNIIINDIDPAIYAFWDSILNNTDNFINLIDSALFTIDEWESQREIYRGKLITDKLTLGFAAFYLNRTNRSGILKAGIIGGKTQSGKYKMDARFNRNALKERIRIISKYRDRIKVYSEDAENFITRCNLELPDNSLIYLDPPYYQKGSQLYTNFYTHQDHVQIAKKLQSYLKPTIITYDSCPSIEKIYEGFEKVEFDLIYSTHAARAKASELLIYKNLTLPSSPFMSRSVKPFKVSTVDDSLIQMVV